MPNTETTTEATLPPLDIVQLYTELYGEKMADFIMPPPIFGAMQCDIIAYDPEAPSLTARMPVLHDWLNPFSTMQGGMIYYRTHQIPKP